MKGWSLKERVEHNGRGGAYERRGTCKEGYEEQGLGTTWCVGSEGWVGGWVGGGR